VEVKRMTNGYRIPLLLCSLVVAGAPARAQAPIPAATSQAAPAEADVRALSDEEVQAFLHRDTAAMARLWSEDFVVTNPLNRFVTKQQVLGMVASGVLVITAFEREIEYAKVYGDTVILAGRETVTWGGKMPNAGRTERLRITAVWMRQGGRWQQVARHANVVPEP
jgi:ketosteroid isomerase-like protein